MYVHLGRGNLVRSKDIIGIFPLKTKRMILSLCEM